MTYTSDFKRSEIDLHCQDCQHWGGWAPIRVGNQVDYNTHGLCNNHKHCRTIADPTRGCSIWTKATNAKKPPTPSGMEG